MLKLNLFDKIKILFDLMIGSPLFIFLFIFSILTLCILLDLKDKQKDITKLSLAGLYLLVLIVLIIKYNSSVLQTIDYFFNNLFVVFYFPNLAVYVVMIIISNILMYKNLFLDKKEPIRIFSLCSYMMIMYMMLLIIHTIGVEHLDVYDQTSVYSSNNIVSLVELSNIIFVIWVIALLTDRLIYQLENRGLIVTDRSKKRIITKVVEKPIIQKVPVQVPVNREVIREVPVPVEKEIIREVKVEVPVEKIVYKDKEDVSFTKEEYIVMSEILKKIQKDMK